MDGDGARPVARRAIGAVFVDVLCGPTLAALSDREGDSLTLVQR